MSSFDHSEDYLDLAPAQLTSEYLRLRRRLRDLLKRAERISRGSGGIYVENSRLAYASILFVRIGITGRSIARLLPDCKPGEHWDFSAVASLTRNLAETYLWYYWLCLDDVSDDVHEGRVILTCLHDHGSRERLFPDDVSPEADKVRADLERRFDKNPYLRTFGEKARREALKGHKTPFVQDDALDRMGVEKDGFRFHYRFFSQHTHSGPVAFLRLFEHDRGKGVETAQEKAYIIVALLFAIGIVSDAIDGHLALFPDAETRPPHFTKAETIAAVERNQGRSKAQRRR